MKNDIIIFLAKYLVFIIALIGAAYWLRLSKQKKMRLAAEVIAGTMLGLAAVKLLGSLYYDPRPFVSHHLMPLISHGPDNGFPSDHTTLAAVIAAILYFYNRKLAGGLLILTILVGAGRVWARVHSPIDILGGLIIGAAAGILGWWLVNKFWPEAQSKKTN